MPHTYYYLNNKKFLYFKENIPVLPPISIQLQFCKLFGTV